MMPTITVEGPPMAVDKKRQLVKGLTEAAVAAFGDIPADAFFVVIRENEAENVGVGGELLCDRRAEGAGQKGAGQSGAGQSGAGQKGAGQKRG